MFFCFESIDDRGGWANRWRITNTAGPACERQRYTPFQRMGMPEKTHPCDRLKMHLMELPVKKQKLFEHFELVFRMIVMKFEIFE